MFYEKLRSSFLDQKAERSLNQIITAFTDWYLNNIHSNGNQSLEEAYT